MLTLPTEQPRVGVGVFILNRHNQFVLGRRKGGFGAGTWSLAGGHLEFWESFEECARREVLEETGLEVEDLRFLTATNNLMSDEGERKRHCVTVFMVGRVVGDGVEPQLLEPDKCEGWEWVSWEEMKAWAREGGEGDGLANGSTHRQEQEKKGSNGVRRLFSPLINLLQQRPDSVPHLSA